MIRVRSRASQNGVRRTPIKGRHDSAAEKDEQRVGRQRLQAEHTRLTQDEQIEQHSQLGRHRVDHLVAALQRTKRLGQLTIDADRPKKGAEHDETGHPRQGGVGFADPDGAWVRSADLASTLLAISSLASRDITT
jgi:hypothetical protein